ncbi:39S ribosomal protein L47, mitochondrial [Aplysia californica]|uniref:Large ribosomal subunit protein uL29m n=1 Tax=Aplysia californica TaxID=6500 RepID=A0ABM0JJ66_APLCA|nr:39S ribosomal protein L47, mitochondrial [Aplysia californica]
MAALRHECLTLGRSVLSHLTKRHLHMIVPLTNRTACLTLPTSSLVQRISRVSPAISFHTSTTHHDLMEFFDRKDVWGEKSVPSGRPWRLDELRIKSSEDLHKLWYVLLKERNMLMTMEAEYNRNSELFPNPERIDKVEESMENILEVVKERDDAVSLLETGKPKQPEGGYVRDVLGRVVYKRFQEQAVPPHMNKVHRLMYPKAFHKENLKYLALYREKIARHKWYWYNRRLEKNKDLVKKFPHLEDKMYVEKPEEPKI